MGLLVLGILVVIFDFSSLKSIDQFRERLGVSIRSYANQLLDRAGVKFTRVKTDAGSRPGGSSDTQIVDREDCLFVTRTNIPIYAINSSGHGWYVEMAADHRHDWRRMMPPGIGA